MDNGWQLLKTLKDWFTEGYKATSAVLQECGRVYGVALSGKVETPWLLASDCEGEIFVHDIFGPKER
jgi:hypothetical protein